MNGGRSFNGFSLLIILLPLWGCATAGSSRIATRFEGPAACHQLLDEVDGAIRNASVTDASSFPVPGFPYLRTSRFLLAMKDHIKSDQGNMEWLRLMRQLDEESREKEILNLPASVFSTLERNDAARTGLKQLVAEAKSCAQEAFRNDGARLDFYETLLPLLKAPDEYSSVRREIGLFPLFSIPVNIVSERVKKRFQAWYDAPFGQLPIEGTLRSYSPRLQAGLSHTEISGLLKACYSNPLKIPLLSENEELEFAVFFAPVLIQDVASFYDRIGRVYWNQGKPMWTLLIRQFTIIFLMRLCTIILYFRSTMSSGIPNAREVSHQKSSRGIWMV